MSKVAVYGIHGFLGEPVINALTSEPFYSKFSGPIVAITRDATKEKPNEKVEFKEAKGHQDLVTALRDVDVVINLAGNPQAWDGLLHAIKLSGTVKLYIPSEFGCEYQKIDYLTIPAFTAKAKHADDARRAGIKTVQVPTGLFLTPDNSWVGGVNPDTKTASVIGDAETRGVGTLLPDVGKALAALIAGHTGSYDRLPDVVRIYSAVYSQASEIKRFEKAKGVSVKVEEPTDVVAATSQATHLFTSKPTEITTFLYALRVVLAHGPGKGLDYIAENERDLVNPGETYFKWSDY